MIFGMADEKMSEGEASPAQVASERLLPRVHALVVLQLVGLGKCFAAYWAGMRSALATVHLGRKKGGNSWQLLLLTEDLSERKLCCIPYTASDKTKLEQITNNRNINMRAHQLNSGYVKISHI